MTQQNTPASEKTQKNTLRAIGRTLASVWRQYSFIFVFIAILIAYAITITGNGHTFNWGHISGILSSQSGVVVGTMALGMALVIITGQIDLSIGSSLVLCTSATILVFNITDNILLTLLTALAVGALCGAINGVLVGYAKMPPFIVTLGTMLIYRSLSLYYVREIEPETTGSTSSQFAMISENNAYEGLRMQFGTGSLKLGDFSLPFIALLFIAVLIIIVVVSKNTKYGKRIYAVGSNEKSAHLSGINTQWIKVSVFIVAGILVGVASFIQACKIGNITPASSAVSYEMYAIAAVVLGGINMSGGRGNLLGVFFGALSYTTISFIIVSIPELSPDIQNTFQGLVLIIVILVQTVGPVIKERLLHGRRMRESRKKTTE